MSIADGGTGSLVVGSGISPRARSGAAYLFFLLFFGLVLLASHVELLDLPYFWDELGQFVPAALDLYERGELVPTTTLPNVHPPGVMLYLAGVWKIFGYSVEATRASMLMLAAAGLVCVFGLAVELCRGLRGLPAFTAAALLLCSPLFFTQSMFAQLDMPAMVFTALAAWMFLKDRMVAASLVCVCLVLVKETAVTTPAVFGLLLLLWERRWRSALLFLFPAAALLGWLFFLKSSTGHWLGNQEFTHYNVAFQLHWVRLPLTVLRRLCYIFVDNFHWIGTIAICFAWKKTQIFKTRAWAVITAVGASQTLLVSFFGGAALERYLLPVLPLFYIAAAAALSVLTKRSQRIAGLGMAFGLIACLFLPSFFPYPFENNLAVVDFVRLQQEAAEYVAAHYPDKVVASAWPFPDALRRPEFGYVARPMKVQGMSDFSAAAVEKLIVDPVDVLVLYSRTWEPAWGVLRLPWVKHFLTEYYFYRPQVTTEEIESQLGMVSAGRYERRGQWVEIFVRSRTPNILTL